MSELIFEGANEKPDDIDEKRESLLVLATLGMTKEYIGEELSNDKIYKLSKNYIEKYFNRYQLVQGKKVADVLRERGIRLGIRMISYFLPIVDSENLVKDLEKDELVNRELSNIIGTFVLKGGRFVALVSGLIQVANHITTDKILLQQPKQQVYQDVDNTQNSGDTTTSQDNDNITTAS